MPEDEVVLEEDTRDAGSVSKHRRKRSTGFPVLALPDAAAVLKEAGKYGFEHPTPAFASYMGHTTTNSGAFRQKLSAFRDWDLVTGSADDMLVMTENARLIAVPTDPESERKALQRAFHSCDVFWQLHERSAKGQPLDRDRLAGRAVHEFGVSPSSSAKFVDSFVESAVAAALAQVEDDQRVILWTESGNGETSAEPSTGTDVPEAVKVAPDAKVALAGPPTTLADPAASALQPAVRQTWSIGSGQIRFEVLTPSALPASAFGQIGDVVERLESLARSLSSVYEPQSAPEVFDGESP